MNIKKLILSLTLTICCLGFLAPIDSHAQTAEDKNWLSIYFGHQEYKGEYGNEMMKFNVPRDFGGGAGLQRYLSPSFDLDFSIYLGRLDYEYGGSPFSKYMINSNLQAHYKFSNGYIFDVNSAVQPFVFAGLGYTSFIQGNKDEIPNTDNFQIPLGVGFNVPLSDNIHFNYKSTYNRTISNDQIDNRVGDDNDNDYFLIHTIGLKFRLGAAQDTDGDGFADKVDDCPNTIGVAETNGCPDRDGDYIADVEDRCPNVAGVEQFGGCPDTDADMIPNSEDRCPEIAGKAQFDGCPEAQEPEEPVTTVKDTDGDGIVNKIDQCVNRAGVATNNGCPVVSDDVKEQAVIILNNIYFATDSAEIHPSSEDHLDELATIMDDDEDLLLHVDGYADSRASEEYNLDLSRERAQAVKDYLVNEGIEASRITIEAHGESNPIASNETSDGKSRNRRVKLTFSYQ